MTLNLRDLAEWCSLNPLSRHAWLPLGASFGLRLLPVYLLAMIVWRKDMPLTFRVVPCLLVAIALLPPPELIISDFGDANYRQQLAIALLALFCGPASALRRTSHAAIHALLAALALLTMLVSMSSAHDLQHSLGLEGTPGFGPVVFIPVVLAFGFPGLQNKRGDPPGVARTSQRQG